MSRALTSRYVMLNLRVTALTDLCAT